MGKRRYLCMYVLHYFYIKNALKSLSLSNSLSIEYPFTLIHVLKKILLNNIILLIVSNEFTCIHTHIMYS